MYSTNVAERGLILHSGRFRKAFGRARQNKDELFVLRAFVVVVIRKQVWLRNMCGSMWYWT